MKMIIFGASHGIGKCLVWQALEKGHEVTAFARNPATLAPYHEKMVTFTGDIIDEAAVNRAIKGHDAVIITIGTKPTEKPVSIFSKGTTIVVNAMKKYGIKTIVCVTGIGAGDRKNHGEYGRILNSLLLKTIYEDKDRQEEVIRNSGLEWLIVRPVFLTNGPLTGEYKVLTDLTNAQAGRISRADVAHFILEELEQKRYFGKAPLLTN